MALQRRPASNHGRWFSVGLWSLTFYVSVAMRTEIYVVDVQTCTGPIHRFTPDEPPPIGRLVIFRKETLLWGGWSWKPKLAEAARDKVER